MLGDVEVPRNVRIFSMLGVPGTVDVNDAGAHLAEDCRLVNLEDAAIAHPFDSENLADVTLRKTVGRFDHREDKGAADQIGQCATL